MNVQSNSVERKVDLIKSEVALTEVETETDTTANIEEFSINGDALVGKVKELLHQGNIRRIIIKNEESRVLIEVPMTAGVVGGVMSVVFFPVIAALGAIGALVAHLTIVVEKKDEEPK
jgi:predicted Abi (CAAX) family protease